jgi:hypothetical protein
MNNDQQSKEISIQAIVSRIHVFREKKVMLDTDLATLYQVETKALNQAVKRNISRFPEDFMFQLALDEHDRMNRSQIVTGSQKHRNSRMRPYVFTEQGVAMLSSVLKSERAVQVNIQIMRIFSKLRDLVLDNQSLRNKVEELEERYDGQFNEVFEAIANLSEEKKRKGKIGFRA